MTFSARQRAPSFSFDGAAVDHRKMPFMPTPDSSAARCLGRWLAAGALLALIACSRGDSVDERIRQAIVDDYRAQLAKALPADKRATLERQLERLERGEPALDEEESLRLAGYQITKTEASFVYRNRVHGYQINLPEGVELQVHRNGQYVIVKSHGSLFGIWVHADDPIAVAEAKLLGEFERWCGEHPDSAKERASNGGALRLVPVSKGPFVGYRAVAKDMPDTAASRFYAFRSPQEDGYFGFDLPPDMATKAFASLQPMPAAPPAPK